MLPSFSPSPPPGDQPDNDAPGTQIAAAPADGWLDPNSKFARFFDRHYAPAAKAASDIGVDPALLLGLAAHESGWGVENNLDRRNNNPFSAKAHGGGWAKFASPEHAWQQWAQTFGPRVSNIGGDAETFVDNLSLDNRGIVGPTVVGDRRGAYREEKDWPTAPKRATAQLARSEL